MKHKGFLDFFPPPKFLEMRPVGLAFSERSVRAVEFVQSPKGLILGRFGMRAIPEGAIKEGYVNSKEAVTEVLSALQKELGIEFVRASLPEEKAYLFKTEVPKAAQDDIRQSIELRLEENVPLKTQDAIFDYALIPEIENKENKDHLDVSVSALPTKVVLTYLEIIKASGLKPVSFGVEAGALSRALVPKGNLGTFMIVNIGETCTGLSVVSRGVVQFNSTIAIGGDAFTSALGKHFSVDSAEAKKIKEERGFVKRRRNMELFFSLMNTVSSLKDEISKLFIYWQTHRNPPGSTGKQIEKIILCGRDSSLVGFDEYLSIAMKVPIEVGNVWQNAFSFDDYIPTIPFLDSLEYASAIGLALPRQNVHV